MSENKKIIVTGGTRGIGRAIALRFAQEGWDTAVCGRSESNLAAFGRELPHQEGNHHILQTADLAVKNDVESFAETVVGAWGSVDVLVNNAGVFLPGELLHEQEGTLEQLLASNLMSTYHMCRKVVPQMVQRGSGSVFNICSTASLTAYPNGGSYGISKFAQLGLTKNLREELKEKNIGVTAIIPGATLTDSWSASELPESRFVDPEHLADLVFQMAGMHPRSLVEEIVIRPQLGDIA